MNGDFKPAFDIFFESFRRLGDERPCVVMHGNDQLGLNHMGCFRRIRRSHGVVVTDGEQRGVDRLQPPQQRHVAEQGGISGMLYCFAVKVDDKAAGMAARYAGTVKGRRNPDKAKVKAVFAAQMHGVGRCTLFSAGAGYFGGRDDGRSRSFGNLYCISQMVVMAV